MNEHAPGTHTTEIDGGIPLIRVVGALDAVSHRAVAAELDAVVERRPAAVLLDLREVDFMGSAGIAVLINAHHHASRLHVPFAVIADNRCVLRPLRMSQVDAALPLHATLEHAVAAVRLVTT
ncbi:STAS domain-containing protein [Saccharothrix sp. BKS2]|uniref:STAS domain-containing protein n=1 Tax=Saccharothrix sp. BKS2 TaxID=3064400 RepID=UPI0039ED324E